MEESRKETFEKKVSLAKEKAVAIGNTVKETTPKLAYGLAYCLVSTILSVKDGVVKSMYDNSHFYNDEK